MSDTAIDISSVTVKWTAKERELWLDLFTNFCESVMAATLEEHSGLSKYPEEQLKQDITLSADLADHAIQEVQYRFSQRYAAQTKGRDAVRRVRR
jgi:hypothetical protein